MSVLFLEIQSGIHRVNLIETVDIYHYLKGQMTFYIASKNKLFMYYSWKCDVMESSLFLARYIVIKQCISWLETKLQSKCVIPSTPENNVLFL